MPMETTYAYHPLGGSNIIRVICIQPDQGWEPLACKILHVPISGEGSVSYEALSYVWGKPEKKEKVAVEDEQSVVRITKNCAEAMKDLRHNDRERLFWIDAICIDQNNIKERNSQVRLMGDIYQAASRVIVYFGRPAFSIEDGLDCIEDLSRPISTMEEDAIDNLFINQSWFNRIWVIQEVARASSAMVFHKERYIPWECFTMWPSRLPSSPVRNIEADSHHAGVQQMLIRTPEGNAALSRWESAERAHLLPGVLHYGSRFNPEQGDLLQQLHRTRRCDATDLKDKVFAVFGLVSKHPTLESILDYSRSVEEVFRLVAQFIIQETRSLKVLCAVEKTSPDISLPSWIPDWSVAMTRVSLGIGDTDVERYNAGGTPAFAMFESNTVLVKGIRLDKISDIGREYYAGHQDSAVLREWQNLAEERLQERYFQPSLIQTIRAEHPWEYREVEEYLWNNINGCWIRGPLSAGQIAAMGSDQQFNRLLHGRSLIVTESGFLGFASSDTRKGDIVCILLGAPVPFILREGEDCTLLVGECYVYGAMNGEGLVHLGDELRDMGHTMPLNAKGVSSAPLQDFKIGGSLSRDGLRYNLSRMWG